MPQSGRAREREVSDEKLMARYALGDVAAFDALFERYERRAYGFFFKRTGSAERAQDLFQELFLRIHRSRDAYDPSRPFTPWLFQIAHRLLVDDRRRAFRSREVSLEGRDLRAGEGPEEGGERDLRRVLGAVSAEERHVLVSAKLYGMDYKELAGQLDKSVSAIKKMASRAMQRLRAVHGVGIARRVKT